MLQPVITIDVDAVVEDAGALMSKHNIRRLLVLDGANFIGMIAFYKLSEEEKKEFMFKDRVKLDELGGKIVMICDCRWSNEEWQFFGVEEWPAVEALEKYAKFLVEELGAYR